MSLARSITPRITAPLRSHGVGTTSCATCVSGTSASSDDSERSDSAEQIEQVHERRRRVVRGQERRAR